jgi:mRNA interferase RelE/StbE
VPFSIHYHPAVGEEDTPNIPRNLRHRIATAIESRLTLQPHQYGVPLRKTLKGYWKLRVGDYRHRKTVYDDLLHRIDEDK